MGTITLTYSGMPNGEQMDLKSSGNISDKDAAIILEWGSSNPVFLGLFSDIKALIPQEIFSALADRFVKQVVGQVYDWQVKQATDSVLPSVSSISITAV